jgi:hypothetical protein
LAAEDRNFNYKDMMILRRFVLCCCCGQITFTIKVNAKIVTV